MNAAFFTKPDVIVITEQFVVDDIFGIHTEATTVVFDVFFQFDAFMKVIPTELIHKCVSIHQADGDFDSKLGISGHFPPDNRPDIQLRDADDPIVDPMALGIIHALLLFVKFLNDFQFITLLLG